MRHFKKARRKPENQKLVILVSLALASTLLTLLNTTQISL